MSEDSPELAPSMEPNTGQVSDGWFYEDNQNTSRFGIRIDEHLHHEESPFQKIDVYRSPFFGRFLTLDGLMMFTERDEFVYHEMLAHIALCSIEDPRRVLIIGGGDCGCAREVLRHPSVEEVVQCDIDERVTRVCEEHFDWVSSVLEDSRMQAVFHDGVEYVENHRDHFDLVIVDSTDPIGPAVGLFQASFFEAVARALRSGGVLANQCESPLWSANLVSRISAQMRQAFSHVHHYWGAVPTYPSGSWCWGYASQTRRPDDFFDTERARLIEPDCRYWSSEIQRGSFALPRFLRESLDQ